MRIFEVKNNLVKIFYETNDNLFLSGFVMIKDSRESYIGQIMHLESSKHGNVAIAKIIFNVKENGVITGYSGSIPAINSAISNINSVDFLKLIQGKNPIIIGELLEQDLLISTDKEILENKLVICSENQENSDLIIKTLNQQIKNYSKKTVIIDIDGDSIFDKNTFLAGENFKLPINHQLINFIYEKGIEYKSARSKAILQETFLEIQYYLSTLVEKYVPVDKFIDILEKQYNESKIPELVLLKNSLIKFDEAGVFARELKEYNNVKKSFIENQTTVINLAYVEEELQREFIAYIYALISEMNEEFYIFLKVTNGNSDKKLLKQIYSTKNIYTTINCAYSYKYLIELKKISKDLILFSPIIQQQDFASYNTFLNKLSKNEFIVYGKATQYMPLIAKISEKAKIMRVDNTKTMTPEEAQQVVQNQLRAQQLRQQEEQTKKQQNEQYQNQQQQIMQQQMQQMMQQQQQQQQMMQQPSPQVYMQPQMIYPQMFAPQPYMTSMPQPQYYMSQPCMPQNYVQPFVAPQFSDFNQMQQQSQLQVQQPKVQAPQEVIPPVFSEIEPQQMPIERPIFVEENIKENQLTEDDLDLIEENDLYKSSMEEIIEIEENSIDKSIEEEDYLDNIIPDENDLIKSINEEKNEQDEEEIPIYPVKNEASRLVQADGTLEKGDLVIHDTFGSGTVEKIINYGKKKLCSVYFEGTGRRLLDPTISELKKIKA